MKIEAFAQAVVNFYLAYKLLPPQTPSCPIPHTKPRFISSYGVVKFYLTEKRAWYVYGFQYVRTAEF